MYAILVDNVIKDIEVRDLPLEELVVEELRDMYKEIYPEQGLKVGDKWNPETNEWEISEVPVPPVPALPDEPTNAQIAQMLSDLYADLVIAGVI